MSMIKAKAGEAPESVKVERCIFYRLNAAGQKVYEIRWTDSAGKYRRRVIGLKISAARTERDKELAKRGRNEPAPANPRLTLGEGADAYLANKVADLRESTRKGHEWAIDTYLRKRFGIRRLDRITADDWAAFIRELREEFELADGSIESVLKSARGIYSYAARRLGWNGQNTLALLERQELPSAENKKPHRMFTADELAATLRASRGQLQSCFATAGTVGSRISETLGLTDDNLDLADLDHASITFTHQIDRRGKRVKLKTKAAERTIEIPRSLAVILVKQLMTTADRRGLNGEPRYVWVTRSGRPLSQRNVARELRRVMKAARFEDGRLAFPILSELDADGEPVKVERGELPSFHSFRHSAASNVIEDGDGAEEAAWLLGHKDSTVTRRVYVEEIKSAERSSKRRGKLEARMGSTLGSLHGSATTDEDPSELMPETGVVIELKPKQAALV